MAIKAKILIYIYIVSYHFSFRREFLKKTQGELS